MSAKKRSIAALCELLAQGDDADRCHALRTLGLLRDPATIPAITGCLYSEDPDVCIDAAEALGRIGSPETVPALTELLENHPIGEVRTAAVEALAMITDKRATAALIAAATQRPENLAWDDEWDDWWDMQLHAVKALGHQKATEAIPALQYLLADDEAQDIETEILTALAQIGGEGLDVLEQRLTGGSTAERRRVATVLGRAGSGAATALIEYALFDKEAEVRCAGIMAIGIAKASNYLKVILPSLKDPETEVRVAAAETCALLAPGTGHIGNVIEQLIPLLEDKEPSARTAAINAAAALASETAPTPEIEKQICRRLSDQDRSVAIAACHYLAQHQIPQATKPLLRIIGNLDADIYLRQQAIQAVATAGDAGEETLNALIHNAISDKEQLIRLESLTALMKLATSNAPEASRAFDAILKILKGEIKPLSTPHQPVKNRHAEPAGAPPPPVTKGANTSLEAISGCTLSEKKSTAAATGSASREQLDTQEELSALQEYLDLAEKGGRQTSSDKGSISTETRILAARVLAACHEEEAITTLMECLETGQPALRKEVTIALGRIASGSTDGSALQDALEPLLAQLESGNQEIRRATVRTLARLGRPEAFPFLLNRLKSVETQERIEAVNGLVEFCTASFTAGTGKLMHHSKTVAQLLACLDDVASGVRLAAARGLSLLLSQNDEETRFKQHAIEKIIAAAYTDEGAQAREMGRILRQIDIDSSVDSVLSLIESSQHSHQRRIAIELLEETLLPGQSRT